MILNYHYIKMIIRIEIKKKTFLILQVLTFILSREKKKQDNKKNQNDI